MCTKLGRRNTNSLIKCRYIVRETPEIFKRKYVNNILKDIILINIFLKRGNL